MKTSLSRTRERGLTLVELLLIVALIAILAMLIPFAPTRAKNRALRIQCLNNLKQIGIAATVWAGDNQGKFPQQISQTNGGTMELITGPNVWRHFQVMSDALSTAYSRPATRNYKTPSPIPAWKRIVYKCRF